MKTLIAEDDYISRLLLYKILRDYGSAAFAAHGKEAVDAFRLSLESEDYFDLICLDIMMPELDGQAVLQQIRLMEETMRIAPENRTKIIMITAVADQENVIRAARNQCDGFLVKPVNKKKLIDTIHQLELLP